MPSLQDLCLAALLDLSAQGALADPSLWASLHDELAASLVRGAVARKTVSDALVSALARSRPPGHLARLSLDGAGGLVTDAALAALRATCPGLAELDLSHCSAFTPPALSSLLAAAAPSLVAVTLARTAGVDDGALEGLARAAACLREVDLTRCALVSDAAVEALVLARSATLERVVLFSCPRVGERCVRALAACARLRALSLSRCPAAAVTDASLGAVLSAGPALEELKLARCRALTARSLALVGEGRMRTTLRVLDISSCPGATAECLCHVLGALGALQLLYAPDCQGFTDSAVRAISQGRVSETLDGIYLSGLRGLSGEALSELMASCRSLRVANFSRCCLVTDGAFAAMRASSLYKLNLAGCSLLTPAALRAVVDCVARSLRILEAARCVDMVTDDTLALLAGRCECLELLDIAGCHRVTGEGLRALADDSPAFCRRLSSLTLAGLAQPTNEDLCHLLSRCPHLEFLNLTGCNVRLGSVELILCSAPRLSRLDVSACPAIASAPACQEEPVGLRAGGCQWPRVESVFASGNPECPTRIVDLVCRMANLRSVILAGMQLLDDECVRRMCASCRDLEHIDVSDCALVTDASLAALAELLPLRLATLIAEGCRRVTDSGVSAVLRACRTLFTLSVSGCPRVSAASLSVAAEPGECPSLHHVFLSGTSVPYSAMLRIHEARPDIEITHPSCKKWYA
eukprot:m51a1_g7639 hypothetical protein (696) ;mRNA; f:359263-361350